jgi:hypothetical protein
LSWFTFTSDNGTFEVSLALASYLETSNGTFYIYDSVYLRNYIMKYTYGSVFPIPYADQFKSVISKTRSISIFYTGPSLDIYNMQIVYRNIEEHAKNCINTSNLVYASANINDQHQQFFATSSGPCTFSIIKPSLNGNSNVNIVPSLNILSINYTGNSSVKVVTDYNTTFMLFEVNEEEAPLWNNIEVYGTEIKK